MHNVTQQSISISIFQTIDKSKENVHTLKCGEDNEQVGKYGKEHSKESGSPTQSKNG